MDAIALAAVLKKPALLNKYSFNELVELSQNYPYASVIYPLIAIKSQVENEGNYEHYLSQAAIRVPDRKKLFHLIHSDFKEAIDEFSFDEIESVDVLPESLPQKEEEPADTTIKTDPQPGLKKEETIPIDERTIELPGKDEALQALKSLHETDLEEIDEIRVQGEAVPEGNVIQTPESSGHTFAEWLSLLKHGNKPVETPPAERMFPVQERAEIPEIPEAVVRHPLSAEEDAVISRQAKESLINDEEAVTETLAKIYEAQKKYDKAIRAYEKLSLKYPDKKAYFAGKIENLKNRK